MCPRGCPTHHEDSIREAARQYSRLRFFEPALTLPTPEQGSCATGTSRQVRRVATPTESPPARHTDPWRVRRAVASETGWSTPYTLARAAPTSHAPRLRPGTP